MTGGAESMTGTLVGILIFAAYFLAFEAIFLSFARSTDSRRRVAKRLAPGEQRDQRQDALIKVRRRRGLAADGGYTMPMMWLNRLIVQSGVSLDATGLRLCLFAISAAAPTIAYFATGDIVLALATALLTGVGGPLAFLAYMRRRRLAKFEAHLPEAMDTLIRSMRAGHPAQAAVRMVVRELPDPVGTEFAIVADELTYGLDLETAMKNMNRRVGQQDLGLLVAAIGLQAKSGGNLAEILGNLSKVIRERLRMRLKVKALSAEARFSALVLSILPVGLFALLHVIAPGYYGEVWKTAIVKPLLAGALIWMMIGDYVMYRMVRFEI